VFRVITVEREFGSGAADIARALASRLGWKLWDKALTEEIANEARVEPSAVMYCDERMDSTFHRLAKTFWRGSYERSMSISDSDVFDTDRLVCLAQKVIERVSASGVAFGHGVRARQTNCQAAPSDTDPATSRVTQLGRGVRTEIA